MFQGSLSDQVGTLLSYWGRTSLPEAGRLILHLKKTLYKKNRGIWRKRAVQLQAKLDSNIITWRWRLYIVFVPKKWNIDVRTTLHDPLAANTRPADQNLPVVYQYCLRMQLRHDLYSNSKTFLYREIINLGIWVNVFSVYWILERAVFRIRKIWKKNFFLKFFIFHKNVANHDAVQPT